MPESGVTCVCGRVFRNSSGWLGHQRSCVARSSGGAALPNAHERSASVPERSERSHHERSERSPHERSERSPPGRSASVPPEIFLLYEHLLSLVSYLGMAAHTSECVSRLFGADTGTPWLRSAVGNLQGCVLVIDNMILSGAVDRAGLPRVFRVLSETRAGLTLLACRTPMDDDGIPVAESSSLVSPGVWLALDEGLLCLRLLLA